MASSVIVQLKVENLNSMEEVHLSLVLPVHDQSLDSLELEPQYGVNDSADTSGFILPFFIR